MPFLLYFFERRNRRRGNRSFCHTFNFFDSAGLFQSKLTHFFDALSPALDKDPFPGGFLTPSSGTLSRTLRSGRRPECFHPPHLGNPNENTAPLPASFRALIQPR